MSSISRIIREERKRLRLTQAELAQNLNVSQATVSRWEKGLQSPDFDSLWKLSTLVGFDAVKLSIDLERREHPYSAQIMWAQDVRIVGGIASGNWVEQIEWEEDDQFDIQIPPLRSWNDLKIEGFVVQDDSSSPYFVKDSIVFCAVVDFKTYKLFDDDVVVVTRTDDRGLFEVSLKEVYITKDNNILLMAISDRPEYQESLHLAESSSARDGLWVPDVTIDALRGVVVSSYRPEIAGRRREQADSSRNE